VRIPVNLTQPIENSTAPSVRGLSIRRMSNVALGRGIVEGGARYGDLWARTSYNAGDRGYGLFLAEFEGSAEYLAVIKHNGDTDARLYSVSTSGAWTEVNVNGSSSLDPTSWRFCQFENYVYAINAVDGIWRRRVGGPVGAPGSSTYTLDDAWRRAEPEFVRSTELLVATSRPAYTDYTWPVGTVTTGFSQSGAAFATPSPGAPDAQNRIYLRNLDSVSSRTTAYTYVVAEIPSGLDLSRVDRLSFMLTEGAGEPEHLDPASPHSGIWLIEDDTVTINDSGDLAAYTRCPIHSTEVDSNDFHIWADISSVPRASRNSVRIIVFGFLFSFYTTGYVWLKNLKFGGTLMLEGADGPPEVEYAYTYYSPSDARESGAIVSKLPYGEADGERPTIWMEKIGAWVALSPLVDSAVNALGYTKIRLYRKETLAVSGRDRVWRYLGEVNNSGTPAWTDSLTETELRAQTEKALSFAGFPAELVPEHCCSWKYSLCLALSRKLFMSYAGRPMRFLPPPEEIFGQVTDEELDAGRTLYLGQGQIDSAKAMIPQDLLYLCTSRGVYVMIGDRASDATPPRLLPGSRPPIGPRAASKWMGGIVIGAQDGLWAYEASRAFTGSYDGTMRATELTETVRDSWASLVAESGEMLVLDHEDEIWCFKGAKFLKLTRPQPTGGRHWEEGSWASVVDAAPDPARGLRILMNDGRIMRAGKNSSGAKYTTDNGSAAAWSVTTGELVGARLLIEEIRLDGEGSITTTIYWNDGQRQTSDENEAFTQSQIWAQGVHLDPASRIWITFSGTVGSAELHSASIEASDIEDKRT
jgi:hypothetical protein